MKKCPKCNIPKNKIDFRTNKVRKDGLQVYCKECDDDMQGKWYQKNKEKVKLNAKNRNKIQKIKNISFILEYLADKKCKNCPENNPIVLEFHHIKNKEYTISNLVSSSWSLEKIKNEIKKCEILCANCHKKETAKQQKWYKLTLIKLG